MIFNDYQNSGKPYADVSGEHGLIDHAVAIVDDSSVVPMITKAMDSDRFRNFMKAWRFTTCEWNVGIISLLRKDFWKEFVNESTGELIKDESPEADTIPSAS